MAEPKRRTLAAWFVESWIAALLIWIARPGSKLGFLQMRMWFDDWQPTWRDILCREKPTSWARASDQDEA